MTCCQINYHNSPLLQDIAPTGYAWWLQYMIHKTPVFPINTSQYSYSCSCPKLSNSAAPLEVQSGLLGKTTPLLFLAPRGVGGGGASKFAFIFPGIIIPGNVPTTKVWCLRRGREGEGLGMHSVQKFPSLMAKTLPRFGE